MTKVEFLFKDKKTNPHKYNFMLEIDNEKVFFYTFDDLSGIGFDHTYSFDLFYEIGYLINKPIIQDYIKQKVKEQ